MTLRMNGRNCRSAAARSKRPGRSSEYGDVDLSQEAGRVLGRNRIDIKARAPLEAGDLGQPRNHLDVPMVMRQLAVVKRRRVNDVVVRRADRAQALAC